MKGEIIRNLPIESKIVIKLLVGDLRDLIQVFLNFQLYILQLKASIGNQRILKNLKSCQKNADFVRNL